MTTAAFAALGRKDEAAEFAAAHMAVDPEFTVSGYIDQQAFRSADAKLLYSRHLIQGGLPE